MCDRVLMTAHLFLWKLYSADVLQRKLVFAAPDETTLSLFNETQPFKLRSALPTEQRRLVIVPK